MVAVISQNSYLEGITVLTEAGEWKIWHNGQLVDAKATVKPSAQVSAANPLHANPPMVKKETAAFYFFPEDEEEVAKMTLPQVGNKAEYSLTKIVQKILAHYNLQIEAEVLVNLKNILFVFLHNTRSDLATWELLQARTINGGVNLSAEVADTILGFVKELKAKVMEQDGLVIDDWGKINFQPLPQVQPEAVKVSQSISKESVLTSTSRPESAATFRKPLVWQEQKLGDVKRSYKLVSPLEELSLMNLEMFRKLGDVATAIKKIKEKVIVLGEESVGKGAQAIQSWRKSPLNQMYIKVGQLSLEQGLAISAVIDQLMSQDEHVLSLAEFEAISDLNQSLRV